MGATHRQQSEASARRGACHGRLADRSLTGRLRPSGPIENRTLTCVTSQYASGCWWGVAFHPTGCPAASAGYRGGAPGILRIPTMQTASASPAVLSVPSDPWAQGFDSGMRCPGDPCPFPVDSVDALAWSSGFIEGKFGRAWCDSRSPI